MSLVFDFADIANRMNRAAKTEPMAVDRAKAIAAVTEYDTECEIDWAFWRNGDEQ